jgi:hypothetical protein
MGTKKSAPEPTWPKRPPVTGIRLPDDLIIEAKHRALDERKTLRELVEGALREYLRKGK